ncbi:MAG: rod shape-determining protein MreC [Alphaproteobacteria bacterium]|nr:rod shape-determining protein MreC [Alphaproteobacteria bacterium]
MLLSIALLTFELMGSGVPHQVRAYANDIVSPVLRVLEQPIRAVQAGLERIAGVSDIYLENTTLKDENDRLRQWREAAMQLSRENERLRQMLKVPVREVPPAATTRVIGVGGGAFERSVLIGAGSADGLMRGSPVIDETGVVGRVIQVGRWTSRVLLVTDINSRVPVRLERTGDLAIAEGQNEQLLRLRFLPQGAQVRVGDRLLTSGHGGAFPPDVPVARVTEVVDDFILMEPIGLLGKLDYVRVMAYNPVPDAVFDDADDQGEQQ